MEDGFEDMVLRCMSEDDRELDDFLSSLLSDPLPDVQQLPTAPPPPPPPPAPPPQPPMSNPFPNLITTPVLLNNDQQQTLLAIQALLGAACQTGAWTFTPSSSFLSQVSTSTKKPKSDKPKPVRIRRRKRQSDTIKALQTQIEGLRSQLQDLMSQKDYLNDRELVLNKLVSKRDEQVMVLEKAPYAVANSSSIPGTNADADGPAASPESSAGSPETIISPPCSADEFVYEWKQFLRELSQHLLNLEVGQAGEFSSDTSGLRHLCAESLRRTDEMALLNRPAIRRIMTLNLEDMKPAQPKPEHWLKIVQMMNLTQEQRTAVRIACEDWTNRMHRLGEARDAIHQRVRELTPERTASPMTINEDQHFLAEALADELSENAMKVWQVCVTFFTTFTSKILDDLQYARAVVYSYPFFIDSFTMIRIIVGEEDSRASSAATPATSATQGAPHGSPTRSSGVSSSQHSEMLGPALSMAPASAMHHSDPAMQGVTLPRSASPISAMRLTEPAVQGGGTLTTAASLGSAMDVAEPAGQVA